MEPVHLLGEVLHHIGALELAVHEDVEPELLLPIDGPPDSLVHGLLVL